MLSHCSYSTHLWKKKDTLLFDFYHVLYSPTCLPVLAASNPTKSLTFSAMPLRSIAFSISSCWALSFSRSWVVSPWSWASLTCSLSARPGLQEGARSAQDFFSLTRSSSCLAKATWAAWNRNEKWIMLAWAKGKRKHSHLFSPSVT